LSFGETQENFTQWFANSTWFDVPVRSHVLNLDNDRETAPNRIGHVESNRVNILTRYSLIPYYYSLAHEAWQTGSPLMEPLAMRFASDAVARTLGSQRVLGDLMIVSASRAGLFENNVYLPAGVWYNFLDGTFKNSTGEWLMGYPFYRDGLFRLPVFAKAGAIVPRFGGSFNQRGLGQDNVNTMSKLMIADVFLDESGETHEFNLTEDDGLSRGFEQGHLRVVSLKQQTKDMSTRIDIQGAVGSFDQMESQRSWTVRAWSPGWTAIAVRLGDRVVAECNGSSGSETSTVDAPCYEKHRDSAVLVRLARADVRVNQSVRIDWQIGVSRLSEVHFVCDEGKDSPRGYGVFVAGDDPALGSWDPEKAIPLHSAQFARGIWTGVIRGLTPGRSLAWKCIRKIPGGGDRNVEWQPGSNNMIKLEMTGGFSGIAKADWFQVRRNNRH
jgi:alpha-glucosidase